MHLVVCVTRLCMVGLVWSHLLSILIILTFSIFFSCVKARARGLIEICYCMSWTCFELSFGIVILFGHICSYVLFESMYES